MKLKARLEFKLADLWIGVFYKRDREKWYSHDTGHVTINERLDVWICFLPCLPVHIVATWGEHPQTEEEFIAEFKEDD